MPRYEVIPSKRYRNLKNDRKASIYGACPWYGPTDKADWVLETVGWTVRDNTTNTIGFGRVPFKTKEEAQAFADQLANPNRSGDPAIAPLQIPTAESEACSCARGEGRHHPDCPAWDSHTDNYQEAPNA